MDLRSIINSDGSGASAPQSTQTHPTLVKQMFQAPSAFKERPPQPPPLQPPSHHHDPRSPTGESSYGSAQSPYQHTSASTLSSGGHYSAHSAHHVASPSPGHGHQQSSYPPRDGYTSNAASHSHNQQFTPSSASPYTPPASNIPPPYYQHQRSQSAQSVHTPNSANSQPPHPYRDSPISPAPPSHSQPNQYQPVHPQQHSQPGTPLGPPPTYPRQSPSTGSLPHGGYDLHRQPSTSPYSNPRHNQSEEIRYSPSNMPLQGSQLNHQHPRQYSSDREKSVSVSPKTVPTQIRSNSGWSPLQAREHQTPVRRDYFEEHDHRPELQRPTSQGAPTPSASCNQNHYPHPQQSPQALPSPQPPPSAHQPTIPSPGPQQSGILPPVQSIPRAQQDSGLKRDPIAQSEPMSSTSTQPPKKRRRRDDGIPIFAQKASKNSSASPLLPSKRQPTTKPRSSRGESDDPNPSSRQSSVQPGVKEEPNGQGVNYQQSIPRLTRAFSVDLSNQGPLGPWEPSITNVIPYEEITRTISDFLFKQVVIRNDLDSDASQGAVFEIEAKIGHLIDKDTGERIKIPVETECVVNKNSPGLRINFESSMTQVSLQKAHATPITVD
jgi:hypothetical protein